MTDHDDWYYLVRRHDGKNISLWDTRHEAVGWKELYHDCNDHQIVPIPPLLVLFLRIANPDHENRVAGRDL